MLELRNIKHKVPKCWQDKRIMRFIREKYTGKKRTTAIAIYVVHTEIASNCNSEKYLAYYSQIGDLAGKSASTVKRYSNEFIKFKILAKNNRFKGKLNLANEWSLLAYSPMELRSGYNPDHTREDSYKNEGHNNN